MIRRLTRPTRALALAALAATGLAVASASPAWAVVRLFATNGDAQVFAPPGPNFVVLNAGGDTILRFGTDAPSTEVVIMFNAECSVAGNFQSWVNVDVLVDPAGGAPEAAVAPSNSDNAFCSGGSDAQDNWVSAITLAPIRLPKAGTHTVRVRVSNGFQSGAGSNTIRIDDTSLVVFY